MSHHNTSKRQRREEEEEEKENDNVSINSSMDNTNGGGDGKEARRITALESRNALLEVRNENLVGKLENQELKAKIRELMEENAALKQTNVEQMVQMDGNKKIGELMQQQQKELDDLKAKCQALTDENKAFGKKAVEVEQKAQREMNELKQTIQLNEIKMEALAEGMAVLKERQETQEIRMEPERLWNQLVKAKKFGKPRKVNGWNILPLPNGLQVHETTKKWLIVHAKEAFGIAGDKNVRADHFPGTIIYYYEMTQMPLSSSSSSSAAAIPAAANSQYWIGLSGGSMPAGALFGKHPNSYAIKNGCDYAFLSGNATAHPFGPPNGGIKLELRGQGDVNGCGLVLNPAGKAAIFFTVNGTLLGKPAPISPTVDCLYPTVYILNVCLEANFGDDQQAKPFKYDIDKCPGMEFV